jgi:hypothetical protein
VAAGDVVDPRQSGKEGWPRRGLEVRPVAIPDDVDAPGTEKATGVVLVPRHVRWSEPDRPYNLDDPKDRASVYEQVLSEGADEDVRLLIDVDLLVELWDDLVLPDRVRRAWAEWFRARRGLHLVC